MTCYGDASPGRPFQRHRVRFESAEPFAAYAWSLACRCGLAKAQETVLLIVVTWRVKAWTPSFFAREDRYRWKSSGRRSETNRLFPRASANATRIDRQSSNHREPISPASIFSFCQARNTLQASLTVSSPLVTFRGVRPA